MTVLKLLGFVLVAVHVFLAGWSVGGFIEMVSSKVPWKPFSNPEFPKWVLIFHWSTILFASGIFLFGYFTRWKLTPHLMAVAYGLMAGVCVVETFGFMTNQYKYAAMAVEYITYTAILILLFRPQFISLHFKK